MKSYNGNQTENAPRRYSLRFISSFTALLCTLPSSAASTASANSASQFAFEMMSSCPGQIIFTPRNWLNRRALAANARGSAPVKHAYTESAFSIGPQYAASAVKSAPLDSSKYAVDNTHNIDDLLNLTFFQYPDRHIQPIALAVNVIECAQANALGCESRSACANPVRWCRHRVVCA